jgi:hypothetical protein
MSDYDWKVLIRSVEEDPPRPLDQRAIAIAEELRKGNPSILFCQMLAEMIHPAQKHNLTEYVLVLQRKERGRPKGPDWLIGIEMERLVDGEGLSVKAAIRHVQRSRGGEKGNSDRKCEAALKAARDHTLLVKFIDAKDE